jgi:hypothetical protein
VGLPRCTIGWDFQGPTPPGAYSCSCDVGRVEIEHASNCEAALEAGCQLDLEEQRPCRWLDVGVCWPVLEEAGRWTCQCDGQEAEHDVREQLCETAIAVTCGLP